MLATIASFKFSDTQLLACSDYLEQLAEEDRASSYLFGVDYVLVQYWLVLPIPSMRSANCRQLNSASGWLCRV